MANLVMAIMAVLEGFSGGSIRQRRWRGRGIESRWPRSATRSGVGCSYPAVCRWSEAGSATRRAGGAHSFASHAGAIHGSRGGPRRHASRTALWCRRPACAKTVEIRTPQASCTPAGWKPVPQCRLSAPQQAGPTLNFYICGASKAFFVPLGKGDAAFLRQGVGGTTP